MSGDALIAQETTTLPGITGLWQVEGKNRVTFKEMIRKDIAYEQKRSLKMDLNIVSLLSG